MMICGIPRESEISTAGITRYTRNGFAPIDNSLIERDIKLFCTGRKNWMFSDMVAGAKASAFVYSLMLTCRACGIAPNAWLRHVFIERPQCQAGADIKDLVSFNCAKTGLTENSTSPFASMTRLSPSRRGSRSCAVHRHARLL